MRYRRSLLVLPRRLAFIALLAAVSAPAWPGTLDGPVARTQTAQSMVIVTPQRFEAELKPFVEHKLGELAIEVAILERVLGETSGSDDPEKLKRFFVPSVET